MRLFIAEKPSVTRAIARCLGTTGKSDGLINKCGPDVVTWCFGHMLEQAKPDHYLPSDAPIGKTGKKVWRAEDLPIVPSEWALQPKPDAKAQLAVIKKLLSQADVVVNAGDPDREGQLLIDEVLEHFNWHGKTLRYWASAQDPASVKKALADLQPNDQYRGWSDAARGRARADWLIGMDLTRAFTLSASRSGQRALLTMGRVQTPTLAIVVGRDREIESFKSRPYFSIQAEIQHAAGSFAANWKPAADQAGLDSEGRLTDQGVADSVIKAVQGQPGRVIEYKQEPKTQGHPRAFSLADITLVASNRWGYSADQVLKTCQSLYEQKLTTYPRTDCAWLPESQHADAPGVLAAIQANNIALAPLVAQADRSIKSSTWNDAKITAHHGIVPTAHRADITKLNEAENRLYDLVCRAFLAQFFPAHTYMSTTSVIEVTGHRFVATGRMMTAQGWKAVYAADDEDDRDEAQPLPSMAQGDPIKATQATRKDQKTKPPARFTEGSLIKMMENVAAVASDPAHKKILREGDGIGTSATRASIVRELKNRGFLDSKGKQIVSTELGRSLVAALPDAVKSPGLTALFEKVLRQVQEGATPLDSFVAAQTEFVRQQVAAANTSVIKVTGVQPNAQKPATKKTTPKPRRATA